MPTRLMLLTLATLLAASCGEAPESQDPGPRAPEAPPTVLLEGVPHLTETAAFAGEACAAMWLAHLGHAYTPGDVFNAAGVDPAFGRGCVARELAGALERIGFEAGPVGDRVPAADGETGMKRPWEALRADLEAGVPTIVCLNHAGGEGTGGGRFRLVLGYDPATDEVIYHDPALDDGAYARMPRETLLDAWPLTYEPDLWLAVRLRLAAWAIASPPAPLGSTPADWCRHVQDLRSRLPEGFTMVLEPPFVVLGDESPRLVRLRSEQTVRWAVEHLKALYFERDPDEILDIWLFHGPASYQKHQRELFGVVRDTPFGYYCSAHRALIMDISTGGGTLVHEIVHPFVRANFPTCPAWFNEALGSLYEQSAARDGRIVGLTNWRLAGLQKAIRSRRLPSFKELVTRGDDWFYGPGAGLHYAEARYLAYWLQEEGLLVRYWHDFRRAAGADPTGWETLQALLGRDERGMEVFQQEWEAWVLTLRYP